MDTEIGAQPGAPEQTGAQGEPDAAVGRKPFPKEKTHTRAGFTTHKGQGESKARRRMAKASRRKNRRGR